METCEKCPVNTISANRAGACSACIEGTVANEDNTKCGEGLRTVFTR
jgi:hypothetical protein